MSYSSIYNLGHRAVEDLLKGPVLIEEKVDGSQFSFGLTKEGDLWVRSKGATMYVDAPERMFTKAVESVKARQHLLVPGVSYFCEFLAKPKHNVLCYQRVPKDNLIVFDVDCGDVNFMDYRHKKSAANALELECVPLLYEGLVNNIEEFRKFLDIESILGGQKIEGVVVKPAKYDVFGLDKKVLMGKFVSETFKESHSKEWKSENPTGKDILGVLGDMYKTPARWQKSIIHLKEKGLIEDSPKDIGLLIKEIGDDIFSDSKDEIKDYLFKWAWPHIKRVATRGFPEYYKEELLKKQFEIGETNDQSN